MKSIEEARVTIRYALEVCVKTAIGNGYHEVARGRIYSRCVSPASPSSPLSNATTVQASNRPANFVSIATS